MMQNTNSRSGERLHLRSQRQNRIPIRCKLKSGFELFLLPDAIVVDIVEAWLECNCLISLDNALCSKEKRIIYLRVLAQSECGSIGWSNVRTFRADLVLRWCKLRQFSLNKLYAASLFPRRGSFPWMQYRSTLKNLTSLQSVIDTSAMDAWIRDLLPLLPHLQDLHMIIKGSISVSSKLFRVIARHCRLLIELRLFNLTSSLSPPLSFIVRNYSKLHTLEAFHCVVSDVDAAHLSTNLMHLNITNRESENTLTVAFVRQLACQCPLLETVSIEQGWGVETLYTPYILRIIGARLKYIRSFTAEVVRWSRPMFAALTAGCTQLREVSLCGCNSMPIDMIHSVLFTMPQLYSLTLSGHTSYNGNFSEFIPTAGSPIQFLSLIEFPALTNKGAANLLRHCPNLTTLNFSSLPLINLNLIDSLVQHCEKMERVYFTRCPTRPYSLTKKRNTLNFNFSVEILDQKI